MSTESRRIAQHSLADENDLITVRAHTKQLSALCGLNVQEQTRLITAVSEVARNALLYATDGKVELSIGGPASDQFLLVTVSDKGTGIKDALAVDEVKKAVGKSTSLVAIKKLVDNLEITSTKSGTTVLLKKYLPRFVGAAKISEWQRILRTESPNTVLQELQDQNKQLVNLLDEVQKVQNELEERTKQLQRANELKAQFLASVSHEIRTPMGAIIGLTNILTKRSKDTEDQRLLSLLTDSATSLLAMINDILDLSKIDEGKLAVEVQAFSLKKLLDKTSAVFSSELESRHLSIDVNFSDEIPEHLIGDENRVRQILINLIGNALKFSDQGTIAVGAELAWKSDDRVGITLSVKDQGIGINQEDLETLFQPFSQLSDASLRRVGGTGLGLSICKRLVELLGGKIGVQSRRGEGSTFWFELPFSMVENKIDSVSLTGTADMPNFNGKRVLLAEDHLVNQIVACDFLEGFGVEVKVANNGLEVLQSMQERQYDLILMDCQMPEMDGFEATAAVRDMESESGKRIPIIAVTANAMAGDREFCLGQGMDDYLSKPYDIESLSAVLSKWLTDAPASHGQMIDSTALLKRFKKEQARRLVQTFISDTETRLVKIRSALTTEDLNFIAHEAHALKGASSLISMNSVKATCDQLQSCCQEGDGNRVRKFVETLETQLKLTKLEAEQLFA